MIQATSITLRRCAARAGSSSSRSSSQALKQHAQRATFASAPLEKTAYHQMHVDMKGKMVPFAGYELPVLYEHEGAGVMNETLHCRAAGKASVFDVSHMGQIKWTGKDAADFIEKCVVGDIKGLKPGEGRLTLITNATGGIVDDTVVSSTAVLALNIRSFVFTHLAVTAAAACAYFCTRVGWNDMICVVLRTALRKCGALFAYKHA